MGSNWAMRYRFGAGLGSVLSQEVGVVMGGARECGMEVKFSNEVWLGSVVSRISQRVLARYGLQKLNGDVGRLYHVTLPCDLVM